MLKIWEGKRMLETLANKKEMGNKYGKSDIFVVVVIYFVGRLLFVIFFLHTSFSVWRTEGFWSETWSRILSSKLTSEARHCFALLWKLARVGICVVDAQNGVFPGRRLQGSHSPQLKLCPRRDQIREGLNWVILCCAGGGPVVCDVCLCVALISVPMGSAFFECSFGAWCTGLFHSTQPMAQPILQDGNEPHVELGIGSCCQWCQWQGTDWLQD